MMSTTEQIFLSLYFESITNAHYSMYSNGKHWPVPTECGSLCRSDPCLGQWRPHCHRGQWSWGPLRWPLCSPHLWTHTAYWLSLPLAHILCTKQNRFLCIFHSQLLLPPVFSFLLVSPAHSASLIPICCLIIPPPPHRLHSPQRFTQRTSTDRPPRERFPTVSSEILPDLLVQVIVSIPLRGS